MAFVCLALSRDLPPAWALLRSLLIFLSKPADWACLAIPSMSCTANLVLSINFLIFSFVALISAEVPVNLTMSNSDFNFFLKETTQN